MCNEQRGMCSFYVAFGIKLIFGTYMAITCFQSHDADGAINDTIVFDQMII